VLAARAVSRGAEGLDVPWKMFSEPKEIRALVLCEVGVFFFLFQSCVVSGVKIQVTARDTRQAEMALRGARSFRECGCSLRRHGPCSPAFSPRGLDWTASCCISVRLQPAPPSVAMPRSRIVQQGTARTGAGRRKTEERRFLAGRRSTSLDGQDLGRVSRFRERRAQGSPGGGGGVRRLASLPDRWSVRRPGRTRDKPLAGSLSDCFRHARKHRGERVFDPSWGESTASPPVTRLAPQLRARSANKTKQRPADCRGPGAAAAAAAAAGLPASVRRARAQPGRRGVGGRARTQRGGTQRGTGSVLQGRVEEK
jgi:hypothetical protein